MHKTIFYYFLGVFLIFFGLLVFLKKMAQHQIIDLTCEDRNTILNEEPEIKIIYENLEVQVIYDSLYGGNKYKKQNSFNYKEYLMKEYWNIHKFNKYQKVKKNLKVKY